MPAPFLHWVANQLSTTREVQHLNRSVMEQMLFRQPGTESYLCPRPIICDESSVRLLTGRYSSPDPADRNLPRLILEHCSNRQAVRRLNQPEVGPMSSV